MNRPRVILALLSPALLFVFQSTQSARGQCVPFTFSQTLSNPSPEASELLGAASAVDGNLAVIGATGDNIGGTNVGAAHVFNVTTGEFIVTLANPTPLMLDGFGGSVAIDGNVAVVGAPGDDTLAMNAGTAYVFNATTGTLITTLNNPNPSPSDQFAGSVSISGDLALIGAADQTVGQFDAAGRAYVFNVTTGVLIMTLTNPSPGTFDRFGNAVAISGNTALVAAFTDDIAVGDSGAVYVFDATTGEHLRTLVNPQPTTNDIFGISVAHDGDVAVVGAYQDDDGATDAGIAYVFNVTTGALSTTLHNPAPGMTDQFGWSVGISGNVVVVGALLDDEAATNSGTAYVFDATTGALIKTLNNPNPTAHDRFGGSVAISGEVAVVGAGLDDAGASAAGNAYVFSCEGPTPGREVGDFDDSGCTDINDFLFLADNWQLEVEGTPIGITDFLALLDNWQMGPECP